MVRMKTEPGQSVVSVPRAVVGERALLLRVARLEAHLPSPLGTRFIDVVFSKGPGETGWACVEAPDGGAVKANEWTKLHDGRWSLRLEVPMNGTGQSRLRSAWAAMGPLITSLCNGRSEETTVDFRYLELFRALRELFREGGE